MWKPQQLFRMVVGVRGYWRPKIAHLHCSCAYVGLTRDVHDMSRRDSQISFLSKTMPKCRMFRTLLRCRATYLHTEKVELAGRSYTVRCGSPQSGSCNYPETVQNFPSTLDHVLWGSCNAQFHYWLIFFVSFFVASSKPLEDPSKETQYHAKVETRIAGAHQCSDVIE